MKVKISLTRCILEKINEAGELTLESLLPRGRAESKIWRSILDLPGDYEFSHHTFSTILSRLKNQGLVAKKGIHRKTMWVLSGKGKTKLDNDLSEAEIGPPKSDGVPRLVVYDIPEVEKRKREWLRSALVSCGYSHLQRSVWLGYCPLPEKFIRKIHELGLRSKVHIVSVYKSGTLEEI